jgi:hypothetical protein
MVYAFASLYILQPNYEKIDYLIQNNKSIQTETKISERPLMKQRSNWVKNWK